MFTYFITPLSCRQKAVPSVLRTTLLRLTPSCVLWTPRRHVCQQISDSQDLTQCLHHLQRGSWLRR